MKPVTKNILIGLSVAITIVLILLIVLFVVVYVHSVLERNEEHVKLGHCVPLIDSALELESDMNVTQGFLKSPKEYTTLAQKCDDAIKCVGKIESFVSADVLHTFSSCQFYVFYNRNFSSCAEKVRLKKLWVYENLTLQLIAKKDENGSCLKTLFDGSVEINNNRCKQWKEIQECVRTQVEITCGDDMTKRYEEEAANLRSSICIGE
ncbi:hypothetical protein B9Z55_020049 [Caenorhabditis nigoni]|uniref:T20D4.11-like domain-containing protein n=1 Tax=Caenorhabditis nigoni TaxID=1611254 RepID=A0A2G5TL56_9PELO|nr:hypothetical protein B9Z55_020049 [Caenorhabditis nigoni]